MRIYAVVALLLALLFVACTDDGRGRDLIPTLVTINQSPPTTAASATSASSTSTPAPPATVTLVAVGDMMFDRTARYRITEFGPASIFDDDITRLLRGADVALGNLECAISERGEPLAKGYTFRAPLAAAETLALAGFDAVSLANNHAMDYGPLALTDTAAEVSKRGVLPVGAGKDLATASAARVIERNGLRIAVVGLLDAPAEGPGFSRSTWEASATKAGVAWADTETVTAAVRAALPQADLVVVMLHFGIEYDSTPSQSQRDLAHAAIDAGATLVIGSHPHVLQPVEEYHGGLIAYSLGNFVFDGFEGEANRTAILEVELTAAGVSAWRLHQADVVDGIPVMRE